MSIISPSDNKKVPQILTGLLDIAPAPLGAYTEASIQSLSALAHIRLRPGMYIGRLGNGQHPGDGIYILLKELIDNAVDEFTAGFGKVIEVSIDSQQKRVRVRDYGRGIPLGKVVDCVSLINTGAKYNDEVFQYSVGLNGVGCKAVNALSGFFSISSFRQGQAVTAWFEQGKLLRSQQQESSQPDGVEVEFWPDEQVFPPFQFDPHFVEDRLFHYSCLNRGLRLLLDQQVFASEGGLHDFLSSKTNAAHHLYPLITYRDSELEFAFTHQDNYGETSFSFVNGQYTSDGGSHLSAFREGVLRGLSGFYQRELQAADVRDGFVGALAIRLKNPIFESQTKNKLGNADLRKPLVAQVRKLVEDYLHRHKELSEILDRKLKSNTAVRKEILQVRKAARRTGRKNLFNIPQLKDCKYHHNDRLPPAKAPVIFLTEGQSATGSLVSSRDVNYQAIFSLRGKPWNCWGYSRSELYRNQELYHLMLALGIDQSEEQLRYQKIILATDADDDGYHIRNLILTYFLYYFPNLVLRQHLFILETPLFRVRNAQQTHYCYQPSERDYWVEQLHKSEITRFKGLGEISPQEFGQFIGPDIRLVPVTLSELNHVDSMLSFFMGKNTPERRAYIMKNLDDLAELPQLKTAELPASAAKLAHHLQGE